MTAACSQSAPHLIFLPLRLQSLDVVGSLADLGFQAVGVSHLRVLLIDVFHFIQSLSASQERSTRHGPSQWTVILFAHHNGL